MSIDNKRLEPKNRIWDLISVWSCDIDRKFYIEDEKLGGQKGKNKPSEPKNGI
jgi:hypothetical protein